MTIYKVLQNLNYLAKNPGLFGFTGEEVGAIEFAFEYLNKKLKNAKALRTAKFRAKII